MKTSRHPESILLAQRVGGDELAAAEATRLRSHLLECDACRQLERELLSAERALASREPWLDPGALRPTPWSPTRLLGRIAVLAAALVIAISAGSLLASVRQERESGQQAGSPGEGLRPTPAEASAALATGAPASVAASAPSGSGPTGTCARRTDETYGTEIQVCPGAGSVGTLLTVSGVRCNNPGAPAIIYFGAGGGASTTGTYGAKEIGRFETDREQRFQARFQIPAALDPIQGQGGGATRPGTYQVYSKPTVCSVTVTVN
jgi:hypothetical protein